jgi:hypothetical protein
MKISMIDFAYQLSLVAYNCDSSKRSSLEHEFRNCFKRSGLDLIEICDLADNSGNANRDLPMISELEEY